MRKLIEKQLKSGLMDINKIKSGLHSRDEIPPLLLGLQAFYGNMGTRNVITP
jgi:hypothetical protein